MAGAKKGTGKGPKKATPVAAAAEDFLAAADDFALSRDRRKWDLSELDFLYVERERLRLARMQAANRGVDLEEWCYAELLTLTNEEIFGLEDRLWPEVES